MPLEPVTYIADLDPNYPAGNDPKNQGDDHLRAIKTGLKGSFQGFTGTQAAPAFVTLTEAQINDAALKGGDNEFTGANEFDAKPTVGGDPVALESDIPSIDLTPYALKRPAYVSLGAGRTLTQADEDKVINFTTGSMTLAVLAQGTCITLTTQGAAVALAIANGSTTLYWLDGSGTVKTGPRAIAKDSLVCLYWRTANQVFLVGSGLS